ncbi:thiamine pyrophosphokinase [Nitratireductor indicus C115]|uniref:Thiamine diphosphokinase n=2 Tax=Nitratireductor indicus TaxID=721133 RepID=K2NRW3_9HYPH|nr:thiamine pyrophosphokinase [Nitratireductor indicus C115]SFQ46499.1 thiamine pyrophosphokinase [Nitratireductor indicus]
MARGHDNGHAMSRFTLLLGGDLVRTRALDAAIAQTRVIAVDSGMMHASALGLEPELWVGDFDSVDDALLTSHDRVPRRVYPPEKDKTDGELAIAIAVEAGASSLLLAGAFGGERPDHMFLHFTQALALCNEGLDVTLTSGTQEGIPLSLGRRHVFEYPQGMMFSILAFSELSGLTVENAKWPLDAVEVPFGSSLTLSNVVDGQLAVTLERGRALLVAHLPADKDH